MLDSPVVPSFPPSAEREPRGSLPVRLGTAIALSVAAAVACALPAALRVSPTAGSAGGGTVHAWMALAAGGLLPMLFAVVVLRGAREGLRAFVGEGAALRAWGVGMWAAMQFVVLSMVGALLRAKTHQHALAGVTYAFVALLVALGAAIVCARIVASLRGSSERSRRILVVALSLLTLTAAGAVGLRFARAVWHDPMPSTAAATVIDVLAFGLAALFSSRPSFASRKTLALLGPPLAIAIVGFAAAAPRDPALRGAIDDRAPFFASFVDAASSPPSMPKE